MAPCSSARAPDRAPEIPMLPVTHGVPTLFIRRPAYEQAGLTRAALDARLGLTDAEFQVDGELVALGPIYDVDALGTLVDDLSVMMFIVVTILPCPRISWTVFIWTPILSRMVAALCLKS